MSASDSGKESPNLDYRPKPQYKHPQQIDDDKNTKLHYAAVQNDVGAIVDYLENDSSVVDPENYLGWTPLMMACRHGHFESVKMLLSYRANATKKNRMGMNVFQITIASGNMELVEYLLDHLLTGGISKRILETTFSNISLAVLFRNQEVLEFLIQKQFQIDMQTILTGVSPLMFAQAIENDLAVTTLLKNKADTKLKNYLGHTAVDVGTIRQQMKIFDTNEHKIHAQTVNNQTELQNQQLRSMLQINKPTNSPADVVQQVYSPQQVYGNQQVPCIVLSPYPNTPFAHGPSVSYLQVPSQILGSRKSSNVSPFPIPPNVTPITPVALNNVQGQVFFPPSFSPSQTPLSMSTQMFNSMVSQSHNVSDLLNARFNSSAGMYLSPPVLNFMSPCM